jgi:hypothetical protein
MKEKLYNEAIKLWSKCQKLGIFNLSFRDILEVMHQTAQFEKNYSNADILLELINEDIKK